jgi:hypothetical protein
MMEFTLESETLRMKSHGLLLIRRGKGKGVLHMVFCGIRVIERPFPLVTVQAKTSPRKKRRIQKKLLARYGTKQIVDPNIKMDELIYDRANEVIYAYPQAIAVIRQQISEWEQDRSIKQNYQGMFVKPEPWS